MIESLDAVIWRAGNNQAAALTGRPGSDLLPWSEVLESLTVKGINSCRSVLQQLSQRQVFPGTGGCDWVCRKLSSIRLVYGQKEKENSTLDGEALVSLVRERWSGGDGFVVTVQPARFEVSCRKAKFANL